MNVKIDKTKSRLIMLNFTSRNHQKGVLKGTSWKIETNLILTQYISRLPQVSLSGTRIFGPVFRHIPTDQCSLLPYWQRTIYWKYEMDWTNSWFVQSNITDGDERLNTEITSFFAAHVCKIGLENHSVTSSGMMVNETSVGGWLNSLIPTRLVNAVRSKV